MIFLQLLLSSFLAYEAIATDCSGTPSFSSDIIKTGTKEEVEDALTNCAVNSVSLLGKCYTTAESFVNAFRNMADDNVINQQPILYYCSKTLKGGVNDTFGNVTHAVNIVYGIEPSSIVATGSNFSSKARGRKGWRQIPESVLDRRTKNAFGKIDFSKFLKWAAETNTDRIFELSETSKIGDCRPEGNPLFCIQRGWEYRDAKFWYGTGCWQKVGHCRRTGNNGGIVYADFVRSSSALKGDPADGLSYVTNEYWRKIGAGVQTEIWCPQKNTDVSPQAKFYMEYVSFQVKKFGFVGIFPEVGYNWSGDLVLEEPISVAQLGCRANSNNHCADSMGAWCCGNCFNSVHGF